MNISLKQSVSSHLAMDACVNARQDIVRCDQVFHQASFRARPEERIREHETMNDGVEYLAN